jgi:integrase
VYITIYKASLIPPTYPESSYALPVGFPYLVDDDNLEVIEPPLLYLCQRFIVYGKYKSGPTTTAAAYDLMDWWRYIVERDRNWLDVDLDILAEYRDNRLSTVSPQTHELLDDKTVRRRIGRVIDFYEWAIGRGLVAPDVLNDIDSVRNVPLRRDVIELAHISGQGTCSVRTVSNLLPASDSNPDEHVAALAEHAWRAVAAELGPKPSTGKQENDLRPCRDRLAAELSLQTGLRVDEVAKLTILQILGLRIPESATDEETLKMRVTITKRLRPRDVYVPVYLLRELLLYIDGERNEALKHAEKYWLKGKARRPTTLFVNSANSRNHAGKPIHADTLSRQFRAATLRAGLIDMVEKIDPDTREPYVTHDTLHVFHDLRHTFAVWSYHAEKSAGNREPWKQVQALLGHKYLSTTLNIYLNHVGDQKRQTNAIVFGAIRRRFGGN